MNSLLLAYWLGGLWVFTVGAVVGSFANVCIYRIPWQKSVIWPGSHCPCCMTALAARDNVPILGWIFLRGRCRYCRSPIAARYPLIEALGGLLFVAVYLTDLVYGPRSSLEVADLLRVLYHCVFVGFLLVATFIDFDYYILPDSVTVTGMVLGLAIGGLVPGIRPAPASAISAWDGFKVGMTGLIVGGAVIWSIRIVGGLVFRKEAMGFGDVTLMAMIGSFLGWQPLPPILFLAAILGLFHAVLKVVNSVRKWLVGTKLTGADREIPFGPYLSMAALILMLGWPWIWGRVLSDYYKNLAEALLFLMGRVG